MPTNKCDTIVKISIVFAGNSYCSKTPLIDEFANVYFPEVSKAVTYGICWCAVYKQARVGGGEFIKFSTLDDISNL